LYISYVIYDEQWIVLTSQPPTSVVMSQYTSICVATAGVIVYTPSVVKPSRFQSTQSFMFFTSGNPKTNIIKTNCRASLNVTIRFQKVTLI
jgi:hypothetical protein